MESKWLYLLRSRKFWAALVGLVFVLVTSFIPDFPMDQEQITNIVYTIVAFILGTALEDGLSRK